MPINTTKQFAYANSPSDLGGAGKLGYYMRLPALKRMSPFEPPPAPQRVGNLRKAVLGPAGATPQGVPPQPGGLPNPAEMPASGPAVSLGQPAGATLGPTGLLRAPTPPPDLNASATLSARQVMANPASKQWSQDYRDAQGIFGPRRSALGLPPVPGKTGNYMGDQSPSLLQTFAPRGGATVMNPTFDDGGSQTLANIHAVTQEQEKSLLPKPFDPSSGPLAQYIQGRSARQDALAGGLAAANGPGTGLSQMGSNARDMQSALASSGRGPVPTPAGPAEQYPTARTPEQIAKDQAAYAATVGAGTERRAAMAQKVNLLRSVMGGGTPTLPGAATPEDQQTLRQLRAAELAPGIAHDRRAYLNQERAGRRAIVNANEYGKGQQRRARIADVQAGGPQARMLWSQMAARNPGLALGMMRTQMEGNQAALDREIRREELDIQRKYTEGRLKQDDTQHLERLQAMKDANAQQMAQFGIQSQQITAQQAQDQRQFESGEAGAGRRHDEQMAQLKQTAANDAAQQKLAQDTLESQKRAVIAAQYPGATPEQINELLGREGAGGGGGFTGPKDAAMLNGRVPAEYINLEPDALIKRARTDGWPPEAIAVMLEIKSGRKSADIEHPQGTSLWDALSEPLTAPGGWGKIGRQWREWWNNE